jgi:hypothetical protein
MSWLQFFLLTGVFVANAKLHSIERFKRQTQLFGAQKTQMASDVPEPIGFGDLSRVLMVGFLQIRFIQGCLVRKNLKRTLVSFYHIKNFQEISKSIAIKNKRMNFTYNFYYLKEPNKNGNCNYV